MPQIEFYETATGYRPVEEFLDSLSEGLNAKAIRDIELLEKFGRNLNGKFSKHLEDGIIELRIQFAGDIARIFYFFYVGDKIVLTNGFIKKTQKTPSGELAKAHRYQHEYLRRYTP